MHQYVSLVNCGSLAKRTRETRFDSNTDAPRRDYVDGTALPRRRNRWGPFSTVSMLFMWFFVGSEQHHGGVENPDG